MLRLSPRTAGRGFTLIELMVGLLLGLITVLIISQVFANSEAQKRSATSGSDAQVNGAMALYTLQRDLQMAGYGLAANPAGLGCPVKGNYAGTAVNFTLAPVVITPKGDPTKSDTVEVLASSKSSFSVPIKVTENEGPTVTYFPVRSSLGVEAGDLLVVVPEAYDASNWCTLFAATNSSGGASTDALSPNNVPHATSNAWNANYALVAPAGGYAGNASTGSSIINLGTVSYRKYTVSNSYVMQLTTLGSGTGAFSTQDLFPQIVLLKALYGHDTNGDGKVDTYDAVTPITVADWARVLTVRVAVVARSVQREKNVATWDNPQWDLGSSTSVSAGGTACATGTACKVPLDIKSLTDWQYYRYKVYDTVVPLRNVLW
jgi:type IV pilus assembly protein PilW